MDPLPVLESWESKRKKGDDDADKEEDTYEGRLQSLMDETE
jgi:hypothetical protein